MDYNSDEIEERVKEVADYMIKTGSSTRKTAEYFSLHRFKISNVTVSNYMMRRLPNIDGRRYVLVKQVIDKNTPKGVESLAVRDRIYKSLSLLLQGYTIPQIVEKMNEVYSGLGPVTFDIIYDDLTRRLNMIEDNPVIIQQVENQLSQNRIGTLNNQGTNEPNMDACNQPRIHGRFASKVVTDRDEEMKKR